MTKCPVSIALNSSLHTQFNFKAQSSLEYEGREKKTEICKVRRDCINLDVTMNKTHTQGQRSEHLLWRLYIHPWWPGHGAPLIEVQ